MCTCRACLICTCTVCMCLEHYAYICLYNMLIQSMHGVSMLSVHMHPMLDVHVMSGWRWFLQGFPAGKSSFTWTLRTEHNTLHTAHCNFKTTHCTLHTSPFTQSTSNSSSQYALCYQAVVPTRWCLLGVIRIRIIDKYIICLTDPVWPGLFYKHLFH